jgi:hypothetical protein
VQCTEHIILQRAFKLAGLNCQNAVYLDGAAKSSHTTDIWMEGSRIGTKELVIRFHTGYLGNRIDRLTAIL